jgi:hypothetical protein
MNMYKNVDDCKNKVGKMRAKVAERQQLLRQPLTDNEVAHFDQLCMLIQIVMIGGNHHDCARDIIYHPSRAGWCYERNFQTFLNSLGKGVWNRRYNELTGSEATTVVDGITIVSYTEFKRQFRHFWDIYLRLRHAADDVARANHTIQYLESKIAEFQAA